MDGMAGSLISVGITVFGIVVGIFNIMGYFATRRGQSRKIIAYEVISQTPLTNIATKMVKNRVQILFDHQPVADVIKVNLKIHNLGNHAFQKHDQEDDYILPITFSFGTARILDAKATASNEIESNLEHDSDVVKLKPSPFTPDHTIDLEVLLSGYRGDTNMRVWINGMSRPLQLKRTSAYRNILSSLGALGFLCFMSDVVLVTYSSKYVGKHVNPILIAILLACSAAIPIIDCLMGAYLYKKGVRVHLSDLRALIPIGEPDNSELGVFFWGFFVALFAASDFCTFLFTPQFSSIH
jgi:hypothetical protein